jgi:hypothetical protein
MVWSFSYASGYVNVNVDRGEGDDRMTGEDTDRRREQRAPIELKVEYKRLNTFFYDYTKNISKGGTFIKTDKPLDIGTVFCSSCNCRSSGAGRVSRRGSMGGA